MMTFLHALLYTAIGVWTISGILIVFLIVMELLWLHGEKKRKSTINVKKKQHRVSEIEAAKDKLRAEKEEIARNSHNFFDGPWVPGFDNNGRLIYRGHNVPTDKAWDYYEKMQELDDTQTMSVLDMKDL